MNKNQLQNALRLIMQKHKATALQYVKGEAYRQVNKEFEDAEDEITKLLSSELEKLQSTG